MYRRIEFSIRGGVRITALWRQGHGTPIVFLHGLCGSSVYFDGAFAHPALETKPLLALDLPGFGSSPALDDQGLDKIAATVVAVMQEISNGRSPWIVAHSMSSSIAARVLDQVGGVTLIEGNLLPEHLDFSDRILKDSRNDYCRTHRRMQEMADVIVRYQTRLRDPVLIERYAQSYMQCGAAVVWDIAAGCSQDVRTGRTVDLINAWGGPVTCLSGALSPYNETAPSIVARLPNVKLSLVAASKHFPMLDNPDETYSLLAADLG